MRPSTLVPPLGVLGAIVSAAAIGLWLQAGPEVGSQIGSDLITPSMTDPAISKGLLLPPRSDAGAANVLFSQRPLLAEGRRSFVPAPTTPEPIMAQELEPAVSEPVAEPPTAPLAMVMLGTLSTADTLKVLLLDPTTAVETWHAVGDEVQGWSIVEILPHITRLQLDGAEITFSLFQ